MNVFLKVIAGVLIALILGIVLEKPGKDLALLLVLVACTMVLIAAINYLRPVMEFIQRLQAVGKLDPEILEILTKVVGIGLIAEITALICTDAGNGALGKTLQILAAAVILWLSIPILNQLLSLIETILGEI